MSTESTHPEPEKAGLYKSLYSLAKFLIWLAIGLTAYYASYQLRTLYQEAVGLNFKPTDIGGKVVDGFISSLPSLVFIGMISMIRIETHIGSILDLIKFTLGWLFLWAIAAGLCRLALDVLSAALPTTPLGGWLFASIVTGGIGALIGYTIWHGRQKKEEDILGIADLFVPIGRAGARYLGAGAVIGAVAGVGLQLLLSDEYIILMALTLIIMLVSVPVIIARSPWWRDIGQLCLLIAVGFMLIDGLAAIGLLIAGYQGWGLAIGLSIVLVGTLLMIARSARQANVAELRLSIGLGIIIVSGVAAVELIVINQGFWGFALIIFAITIMAVLLAHQYNVTLSKSGGNNVDKQ